MDKKSILLIMPYGSVGGMERLALSFYNFYKSIGFNVKALKFIQLQNDIINFEDDELYLSKKDFSEMPTKDRLFFYLTAPNKIKKIVKKHGITHSIAFGDMANLFSSLSFSSEYKIGSIHALKSAEFKNDTFFHKLTKLGYKSSYRNLNKVVCISKAIKEDLIKNCGYKFSNLEIIYNPHDVKQILKLAKQPIIDPIEKKVFETPTILFLGRLSIQKAPWHLIKAFKLLTDKISGVNLIFIGDGDEHVTKHVKDLILNFNLADRVHLLGRRENPYMYLARTNILALSSYYEGTPNVIVEAIAVGTPIVSTNCTGGIGELMSLNKIRRSSENQKVESGIITPNLFKGKLDIPKSIDFIKEEELFSDALQEVLKNNEFSSGIIKHKEVLLNKFNLTKVAYSYLN